jgi:tRNA pseudouridine55 synthase
LDPAASGVLVVAIGREFTKQLSMSVDSDKEYVAKIILGTRSSTDDGEGVLVPGDWSQVPSAKKVQETVTKFVGEIMQVPPAYSAIKMGGKKAYELARKGKEVIMKPRKAIIHSIEVLDYHWPELEIHVHCGKGVYIRSLARDIGEALRCGGYMAELKRTRVGEFTLEKSMTVDQLKKFWMKEAGEG